MSYLSEIIYSSDIFIEIPHRISISAVLYVSSSESIIVSSISSKKSLQVSIVFLGSRVCNLINQRANYQLSLLYHKMLSNKKEQLVPCGRGLVLQRDLYFTKTRFISGAGVLYT